MRCMDDFGTIATLKQFCRTAPAAGLVVALAISSSAQAQLLNPFPGYRGPVMNDQDRTAARDALQTLLDQNPATVGKTKAWSNPADGRHGSLTVAGSFHHNGMDCRTIESSVSYPEWATPRKFTLRFCLTPGGEWKTL